MAFNDTFNRLERLALLIQRKSTGSPEDLAKRMGVSRRTVYNLIDILKNQGAEIEYCRNRNSFFYVQHVKVCFRLFYAVNDLSIIQCEQKEAKRISLIGVLDEDRSVY